MVEPKRSRSRLSESRARPRHCRKQTEWPIAHASDAALDLQYPKIPAEPNAATRLRGSLPAEALFVNAPELCRQSPVHVRSRSGVFISLFYLIFSPAPSCETDEYLADFEYPQD